MFLASLSLVVDNRSFFSFFNANRYDILQNLYEEDKKKTILPLKVQILEENAHKNKTDLLNQIKKLDDKKEYTKYYESLLSLLLSNCLDEGMFQQGLEKINERSVIRKKNGVYYTPEDVSSFILTNSLELALNGTIHKLTTESKFLSIISANHSNQPLLKSKIIESTILDPTCGTGAFLVKAFDLKIDLLKKLYGFVDKTDVLDVVRSLHGNDIDSFSTYITQTRLLFKAITVSKDIDISKLLKILQNNFLNYDFVSDSQKINEKFDFIIGNPPYVEKTQMPVSTKARYGNIYADVIHNSLSLLKNDGVFGYIVPISYISTPRFSKLRAIIQKNTSEEYVLSYADRPDCLFAGVHQKLNILIARKNKDKMQKHITYTSDYDYWYKAERSKLFDNVSFVKNNHITDTFYPKIGSTQESRIYERILAQPYSIQDKLSGDSKLYLNMRATFWIKSFISIPYKSKEYKELCFDSSTVHFINIVFNSSLFWWFWVKVSDCWHITQKELSLFRIPQLSKDDCLQAKRLSIKINDALESTKERVNTKQTLYEYKHKHCKEVIDELDNFLANLYNISADDLEYIKSYKKSYRLGIGSS